MAKTTHEQGRLKKISGLSKWAQTLHSLQKKPASS